MAPADPSASPHDPARTALPLPIGSVAFRAAGFFVFWIVLIASGPSRPGAADLVAGAATAGLATWASLRLLPGRQMRLRPLPLLHLAGHFLWQSVRAGVDVARRAFSPRLPLRTGTLTCRVDVAPGVARDLFTAMTSLLPGTVPLGPPLGTGRAPDGSTNNAKASTPEASLAIEYHCLDVDQPIAAQLDREATLLTAALGDSPGAQTGTSRHTTDAGGAGRGDADDRRRPGGVR